MKQVSLSTCILGIWDANTVDQMATPALVELGSREIDVWTFANFSLSRPRSEQLDTLAFGQVLNFEALKGESPR